MKKKKAAQFPMSAHQKWLAAAFAVLIIAAVPWLDFLISVTNRPIRIRTVIAHRGNGFGEAENTVRAINAAHAHGFVVEVDVQLSKNNILYLMHDDTLDRTTNCTGPLADKDEAGLETCGVDTLDEAIATNASLELDLKNVNAAMIAEVAFAVTKASPGQQIALFVNAARMSFETRTQLKQTFPRNAIFWYVNNIETAKKLRNVFDTSKDLYSVCWSTMWQKPALLRYVTNETQRLGAFVVPNRWSIMGMPITHIEVDNPLTFESQTPSPTMPELVYRASGVGIVVALVAGWLIHGWAHEGAQHRYTRVEL